MEPTIYRPSIYKGAGIYKTGAGGGGGGDLPEGYTEVYAINNPNGTTANPGLLIFDCDATTHDIVECQFLFTRTDLNSWFYPVSFCNSNNYTSHFFHPEITNNSNNYGVRDLNSIGISSAVHGSISYPSMAQRKPNLWIKYSYPDVVNSVNGSNGEVSSLALNINAVVLWPNFEEYKGAIKRIIIERKLDLIPCLDENNQAGFYDKVNGVFKGNANLIAIE